MDIQLLLRRYLFLAFLISFSACAQSQSADSLRVLFVGNSFTYFYNVPQTVQAMAKDQGVPMIVRQSTAGGATWQQHWNGDKDLTTHTKIKDGDWDIVILQNHSRSTIDHLDRFMDYGQKWNQKIKDAGAKTVLYQTWAYESDSTMIGTIRAGYQMLGEKINADVVPIGVLFDRLRKTHPSIDLFSDDKHQSMEGSYMIALAFYKYLTNKSVIDIPPRLTTTDQDGEKTYLMIIHPEEAALIKALVDQH